MISWQQRLCGTRLYARTPAQSVAALLAGLLIALGAASAGAQPAAAAATTADTSAEIAPPVTLTVGKSTLLRLPAPIERISIGNPNILDVTLTGTRELYLLGKALGASNVMLWRKGGSVMVVDISVTIDTSALQQQIAAILPAERGVVVRSASDSIVLSGTVSSALKADQIVSLAEGFSRANARNVVAAGQGIGAPAAGANPQLSQRAVNTRNEPQVINLMTILQPQQVMLEVKVAEVSRTLLDQFGVSLNLNRVAGSVTWGLITSQLQDVFGRLGGVNRSNGNAVSVDGKLGNGLVKVLAEPTIVSVSGQEASFLAGGKIFLPVGRTNNATGQVTITLEEKEFGVGLKFTPVVLDGDMISLKVAPEVSELARAGSPFVTTGGVTTVLPSFTSRRVQTTVQLRDGQSLAIAGLIKNNVTENVDRFPFLGEIPVLGALFRSTEFQTDRSELLFVITPRLVQPLQVPPPLPTDSFTPPSRGEWLLKGQLEGAGRAEVPPDTPAKVPAAVDKLQLK